MGVPIVTTVVLVAAAALAAAQYYWLERRRILEAPHLADLEMMETAVLSKAIVASLPLPIAVLDRAGTLISAHDPIATPPLQSGARVWRQHHLQVRFAHHDVPRNIPRDVALCVYQIVQEALHNVIKHSGVMQAEVHLTENHVS